MSDEYANQGLKGTLVNSTAVDVPNYPPEGDSTGSGGYGSPQNINVWSPSAQRGATADKSHFATTERVQGFDALEQDVEDDSGLVKQSLNGGDLRDVMQGIDGKGINPYAGDSFETASEAKAMLAKTSRSPPTK